MIIMEEARLIVIGQCAIVREGFCALLQRDSYFKIIGSTDDSTKALGIMEDTVPNAVIISAKPTNSTTIDFCKQIIDHYPGLAILILICFFTELDIIALVKTGVRGILRRNTPISEIADAIRIVINGGTTFGQDFSQFIMAYLTASKNPDDDNIRLHARELEILTLVAKGMRNQEISDYLFISARTVQSHLNNVYAKLEVSSRLEAVNIALKRRWITLHDIC